MLDFSGTVTSQAASLAARRNMSRVYTNIRSDGPNANSQRLLTCPTHIVPFGEVNCLPIPDSVSDEEAIYLSDVLPTSYHCVTDTGVTEGDTVGIWGLGPVGLAAARWCQLKGAKRIIGIDGVSWRLQRAVEKLGIEVINFNEVSDIPKKIHELVPGGLDKALDCGTFHEPKSMLHKIQKALMLETDVPETANECILSVRKMGSIGLISVYGMLMGIVSAAQAEPHRFLPSLLLPTNCQRALRMA